jgi:uncharacterized SAM-binding protein YcdF (DUF218 family)
VFLLLSKLLDLALAPLSWALALLLLAGVLRRRARASGVLAAVAFLVLAVFATPVVANRLQGAVERGTESTLRADVVYDAAIVLGGMVDADASRRSGAPELLEEADRVVRAFELWRAGRVRQLVLVGGTVFPEPGDPPESERLRALLAGWGVPADAIVVEGRSRNTRENAVEAARLVRERGFGTLLLVTSAGHVPRALGCFRAVGLAPDVLAVDRRAAAGGGLAVLPRASALERSTSAIRELAGRAVYRLAGYTRGEAEPRAR